MLAPSLLHFMFLFVVQSDPSLNLDLAPRKELMSGSIMVLETFRGWHIRSDLMKFFFHDCFVDHKICQLGSIVIVVYFFSLSPFYY